MLLRSTTTFPRGLGQPRRRRKALWFFGATAFQAKFSCDDAITGEFVRCNQNLLGRTFSASFSSLTTSLPHHHLHLLLLRRQPRRLRKFPRRPRRSSSPFSRSGELAILIIAPPPPERRKARRRKSISQTKPPFRYKKKKRVAVHFHFLGSCRRPI